MTVAVENYTKTWLSVSCNRFEMLSAHVILPEAHVNQPVGSWYMDEENNTEILQIKYYQPLIFLLSDTPI